MAFLPLLLSGCSAIWHPYARTIEHKMEVLNRMPRSEMRPIDPRLLGQTPPPEHLVDDGDILGVYIEGAPGPDDQTLPVRFPDDRFVSPAIGYPTPVRNGGFIRVPQIGVLHVRGMTPWQIEERIRHILTVEKGVALPDESLIHVSLMWKRGVNVMVVRQEEVSSTQMLSPTNGTDSDRRSGQVVQLPAFRNDVMNALLETGGFPSDQGENAVYVFKRWDRVAAGQAGVSAATSVAPKTPAGPTTPVNGPSPIQLASYGDVVAGRDTSSINGNNFVRPAAYSELKPVPPATNPSPQPINAGHAFAMTPLQSPTGEATSKLTSLPSQTCLSDGRHPQAIRIPLAVSPGQMIPFSANDVILEDGDIVLVESRENEFFTTAGLLGGGQYSIPRQHDIDVIDAVLLADSYSRQTQLNSPTRAIGGVSVLNRDVTVGASRVIIERKTQHGEVQRFRVNLYGAMRNPDQRVLIEPGDRLYLEYTPIEAFLAFFERHLFDPILSGTPAVLTN